MKKILILTILVGLFFNAESQVKFNQGYFISNTGQKVECLIRNDNWRNNPEVFTYKLTETSREENLTVNDVKEVTVKDGNHFIVTDAMIDFSSDVDGNLSDKKDPEWMKKKVFLNQILDGDVSLYKYRVPGLERYFISTTKTSVHQLVYKRFLTDKNEAGINFLYRQQLWEDLDSVGLTEKNIERVMYDETSITNYILSWYRLKGIKYKMYKRKIESGAVHLFFTPGMSLSSLKSENNSDFAFDSWDFGSKVTYRIGITLELIFPYTNKKLAFLFEPVYRKYSESLAKTQTVTADFNVIEMNAGFRYIFYLGKNSKLFINALATPAFTPGSQIYYEGYPDEDFKMNIGIAAGAGFSWKRLGCEIRYYLPRKISSSHQLVSHYSNLDFILGIKVF